MTHRIKTFPGCDGDVSGRIKYAVGHTHCNAALGEDGVLVGAQGMEDEHCTASMGTWGIPIVDTKTHNRHRVLYYPLEGPPGNRRQHGNDNGKDVDDAYETLLECWSTRGVTGCEHLSVTWLDEPWPLPM